MSPRPYRLGLRQSAIDETRARIIGAAEDVLAAPEGAAAFTVEAVAGRANVARMTVYYQFGSKLGLLEALYDNLAAKGLVAALPGLFSIEEPRHALLELVRVFFAFWDSSRLVQRRARALAWLDPEIEQGVWARDERRRQICRTILGRVRSRTSDTDTRATAPGRTQPQAAAAATDEGDAEFEATVNVLFVLTSFETYDLLRGSDRRLEDVLPAVQRLALTAAGLNAVEP